MGNGAWQESIGEGGFLEFLDFLIVPTTSLFLWT